MSLSQVQSAPLNSTVNVAIGPALLPHVQNQLPQIIAHHPTVDVEFFRMPSIDQALIDMDNGEIDVALYTSPTLPPKRVDHSLIRTVKLGLFAPAGTTLDMVVGENASFPVVLPFEHAWMTAFIAQKMKQRGIGASNVVGRTQYPDILVRLMVDRGAITAISSDLLQPYVEDGTLTCLIPDLGTLYRLAVYSNRPFSPAQRMFLDTLIDIVGRIGEPPEEALAGRP
ncbi:MAG: LysR substrate-binding domain-containing protein [Sphingobium sp.]